MPWDVYLVAFRGDEVRRVGYVGTNSERGPQLHDIRIGASLEQVSGRLGTPTHVSIAEDELSRIVSYSHLNSYYDLRQNQVNEVGIFNPKLGPPKFEKEKSSNRTQ